MQWSSEEGYFGRYVYMFVCLIYNVLQNIKRPLAFTYEWIRMPLWDVGQWRLGSKFYFNFSLRLVLLRRACRETSEKPLQGQSVKWQFSGRLGENCKWLSSEYALRERERAQVFDRLYARCDNAISWVRKPAEGAVREPVLEHLCQFWHKRTYLVYCATTADDGKHRECVLASTCCSLVPNTFCFSAGILSKLLD